MVLSTAKREKQALPARVVGFLARTRPQAVLLRRGPTNWFQLICWDIATDTFEDGQWFRGMIYDYAADLSPDGRLFLYGAAKYHTRPDPTYTDRWTAISHPPYYTALALWPQGQVVGAALGGLFLDATTVALNTWTSAHPHHLPAGLQVRPNERQGGELLGSVEQRLLRDGWTLRQQGTWKSRQGFVPPRIWHRDNPEATVRLLRINRRWNLCHFALLYRAETEPHPIEGATWADWDQRGRLVFARAGKLFAAQVAGDRIYETELADFNSQAPAPLPAPVWAAVW